MILFTHNWLLDINQRKSYLQFTTPEILDNKKTLGGTYMDSVYMGSGKNQDLLSKWEHGG